NQRRKNMDICTVCGSGLESGDVTFWRAKCWNCDVEFAYVAGEGFVRVSDWSDWEVEFSMAGAFWTVSVVDEGVSVNDFGQVWGDGVMPLALVVVGSGGGGRPRSLDLDSGEDVFCEWWAEQARAATADGRLAPNPSELADVAQFFDTLTRDN